MIILRKKTYSDNNSPSSSDLMEEQMKMQRELLKTQRQREKMRSEETRRRLQVMQSYQRQEAQKDQEEEKNQIKTKKIEQEQNKPENIGLYKSRSKIVTPIPMRG